MYNPDHDSKNPDQDSDADNIECEKHFLEIQMQKVAPLYVSREPQMLLDLTKECYFCINILSETTKRTPQNIMNTLKTYTCINLMPFWFGGKFCY